MIHLVFKYVLDELLLKTVTVVYQQDKVTSNYTYMHLWVITILLLSTQGQRVFFIEQRRLV